MSKSALTLRLLVSTLCPLLPTLAGCAGQITAPKPGVPAGNCPAAGPLPAAPSGGPLATGATAAVLAGSGEATPPNPLPPLSARDPSEAGLTPLLHVTVPGPRCTRMVHLVNLAVAIPSSATLRSVEASLGGAPLSVLAPGASEITETPHSYGEQVPFFRPVFSLDGATPGKGTLEVRGYDAAHALVATQKIDVEAVAPPSPISACQAAALGHPRIWLTPERLAKIKARDPGRDAAAVRFLSPHDGVGFFLDALAGNADPTSTTFGNAVYDPESYVPALALCYQLSRSSDPARARTCAEAARTLTVKIARDYDSGVRTFSRDSGYDIRFGLMYLMVAFDWIYDQLSSDERALFVKIATRWIDWYQKNGYANSHPYENYYAGYLQGLTLAALATAGDNPDGQRLLDLLHQKLYWEVPTLNQRVCGGDWPEGWNYGPYSLQELALVNQTLKDFGEDWSAAFDFLAPTAAGMTYQMSPDFTELRSFGGYSGTLPHKTSPSLLAVLSATTASGPLAARLYQSALDTPNNDLTDGSRGFTAFEMIFLDRATAAPDVGAMPLSFFAPGTGRFFSRSSLTDPAAYQVTAENMSYYFDHYGYANGDVRLYHGPTCLVCPAAYRGSAFRGEDTTPAFSTFLVNGKEQGSDNRNNQNLFTIEGAGFSAIGMRLESSYVSGGYDEQILADKNPLDYLIREAVHVRPGVLVVRDLVRPRHPTDTVRAAWHLGPGDAVASLGGGAYRIGALNVSTFGARTTTFSVDTDAQKNPIGTLMQDDLPTSASEVELVTVFSDSATATSYQSGVLKLSTGQCVTFASGTVAVSACP